MAELNSNIFNVPSPEDIRSRALLPKDPKNTADAIGQFGGAALGRAIRGPSSEEKKAEVIQTSQKEVDTIAEETGIDFTTEPHKYMRVMAGVLKKNGMPAEALSTLKNALEFERAMTKDGTGLMKEAEFLFPDDKDAQRNWVSKVRTAKTTKERAPTIPSSISQGFLESTNSDVNAYFKDSDVFPASEIENKGELVNFVAARAKELQARVKQEGGVLDESAARSLAIKESENYLQSGSEFDFGPFSFGKSVLFMNPNFTPAVGADVEVAQPPKKAKANSVVKFGDVSK